VTLVGACPDSLALIYEYLPNRSLGDRLSYNDNTPSLPWKTRIRILTELNSVLNFLHSIQPSSIIHSNLNLKNILLDANFCCKLTDFGSCHIIPKNRISILPEIVCNLQILLIKLFYMNSLASLYMEGSGLIGITNDISLRFFLELRHE
jgi:serine/threonine protein kinase